MRAHEFTGGCGSGPARAHRGLRSAAAALGRAALRAWRRAAERRAMAAARTVLHAGRRRPGSGLAYRAWFDDPARLDRLQAPVASFAWSIEASAEVLRRPGAPAHFALEPLTRAEIDEFRRRFAPSRDEVGG